MPQQQFEHMEATLEFNPAGYSERSLRLILAKAQEWQVTPAEAVSRLMDELAKRRHPKPPAEAPVADQVEEPV